MQNNQTTRMPMQLSRPDILPPFPVDYLPPDIADFVRAISENLKVYPDMPATYSLAILSLCCQQKAKVQATTTWAEEMNLYMCIVADPSEMKSPVFNAMIEPVREYVEEYNKAHAAEIATANDIRDSLITQKNQLKSKRGNEQEIRKLNEEIAQMKEQHLLNLVTTDSTNEALIEMMEENNGSVGVMCDEGGIFQVAGGLYSDNNSNINCYSCGYDGQEISVNRKTRNIHIPRATITMGIFCQKKVLADIMSNTSFTGKGLTQRFVYCMPESKVGTRNLSESNSENFLQAKAKYSEIIKKLLELPMTSKDVYIRLTPQAKEAFASYYSVLESRMKRGGEYEDFHDYFGKFAGRTLRFAGLLHMAKYQDINRPIDAETMGNAYVISEYFIEHTKMVLGYEKYDSSAEKLLEKLADMCRKKHTDLLTVREINKKIRNILTKEQFEDAVEELEIKGYILHIMPEKNRYNNRNLGSYQINHAWLSRIGVTIGQNP